MPSEKQSRSLVIRHADRPGDLGWVVMAHGEAYHQQFGWNTDFEALVAQIVATYATDHDPGREAAWIAEVDGKRAGCIFLVAGEEPSVARLRILLVMPTGRGTRTRHPTGRGVPDVRTRRRLRRRDLVDQRRSHLGAQDLSVLRLHHHRRGTPSQFRPRPYRSELDPGPQLAPRLDADGEDQRAHGFLTLPAGSARGHERAIRAPVKGSGMTPPRAHPRHDLLNTVTATATHS